MAYKFLGIEASDGDACECCGTPCPRRRVVIETEGGEIRKLGSTCASLSLRASCARKARVAETAAARRDKYVSKANGFIARGDDVRRVAQWLGCFVRCHVEGGRLVID